MQFQSAERTHRVELAACYRLIAHYRMADLIYTHATLRLPDMSVRSKVAGQADAVSFDDGDLALEWDAHLRLLDRIDRSYRQ